MNLDIVVMAAGKGTRMNSELPKVLHSLAGRPMIQHVLETADSMNPNRIITVVGYRGDMVKSFVEKLAFDSTQVLFANQMPQLGTGHAVQMAVPYMSDDGITIVLNGDVPLIKMRTLSELYCACAGVRLALLTVDMDDPTGYGRIVTHKGKVLGIVEHKDASEEQREIKEVYTGILAAPTRMLKSWLYNLSNDNAQNEYYLTDIVEAAVKAGISVETIKPTVSNLEVVGVNSPEQLFDLEQSMSETV